MEILLRGKYVHYKEAKEKLLVDHVIKYDSHFLENIRELVWSNFQKKEREMSWRDMFLEENCVGRTILDKVASDSVLLKTRGNYEFPITLVKTIFECYGNNIKKGLEIEEKAFSKIVCSQESKNLLSLGFMMDEVHKMRSISEVKKDLPEIHKIVVLAPDCPKKLKNMFKVECVNFETLKTLKNDYNLIFEFSNNLEEKREILSYVQNSNPNAIYVSCGEYIQLTQIINYSKIRKNVIGCSFFSPMNRLMPFVEIIKTPWTSDSTIARFYKLNLSIGKLPIIVKDSPGFLTTRLFAVFCIEAANLLFEGHSIVHIDNLLTQFGMNIGPFEIMDEIGLDIVQIVLPTLSSTLGKRFFEAQKYLKELVDKGCIGKKSRGVYIYNGKEKIVNPIVTEILLKYQDQPLCSDKDIIDRCIFVLMNECAQCLMDGIVKYPEEIEIALICGLGFPPFRGGILQFCDDLNQKNTLIPRLKELESIYGTRFHPCKLLKNMSVIGQYFFPERIIIPKKPKSKL